MVEPPVGAPVSRRVLAALIDGAALLVPVLAALIVREVVSYRLVRVLPDGDRLESVVVPDWARWLVVLGVFGSLAIAGWDLVVVQGRTGRSLGKRAVGIRLGDGGGRHPVGAATASTRLVLTVVGAAMVVPLLIDLGLALADPARRRGVDRLLGTMVVSDAPGHIDLRSRDAPPPIERG